MDLFNDYNDENMMGEDNEGQMNIKISPVDGTDFRGNIEQDGEDMFEGIFSPVNISQGPQEVRMNQNAMSKNGIVQNTNDYNNALTFQNSVQNMGFNGINKYDIADTQMELDNKNNGTQDMDIFYDTFLDIPEGGGSGNVSLTPEARQGEVPEFVFPTSRPSIFSEEGLSIKDNYNEKYAKRFRADSVDSSFKGSIGPYSIINDNVSLNGNRGAMMYANFGNDLSPITTTTSITPSLNSAHSTQPSFFSAQQYMSRNSIDHYGSNSIDNSRPIVQSGRVGRYSSFTNSISNYIPFMSDRNHRSPNLRTPPSHTSNSPPSSNASPEGNVVSPKQSRPIMKGIFKRSNINGPNNFPNSKSNFNGIEISAPFDVVKINADSFGIDSNNIMLGFPEAQKEIEETDEIASNMKQKRNRRGIFNRFKTPSKNDSLAGVPEGSRLESDINSNARKEISQDEVGNVSSDVFTMQTSEMESNSSNSSKNANFLSSNNTHDYTSLFGNIGRKKNKGILSNSSMMSKTNNKESQKFEENSSQKSLNYSIENQKSGRLFPMDTNDDSSNRISLKETNDSAKSDSMYSSEEGSLVSQSSNVNISSTLANASRRILGSKLMSRKKAIAPSLNAAEKPINPASVVHNGVEVEIDLESLDLPPGTQVFPTSIINSKRRTRGRKENFEADINDSSKIFLCNYCSRRFKRQEHLKRHFRSLHTFEKPYSCDICNKKFSRSDNLNQHLKIHKQEKDEE